MARKTRNEVLAGMFVIGGVAAVLAVAIWLSGVSFGGRFFYMASERASGDVGLVPGSKVKVGPVDVGEVVEVTPSEGYGRFVYKARLWADVDIRQDALIQTSSPALGGVGTANVLDPGQASSPPADREHPAPLDVGPNVLIRDMQNAVGFGEPEKRAVQTSIAAVKATAENLAAISESLKRQLTPAEQPNLLGDLEATAAGIREMVETQLDPSVPTGAVAKLHVSLDDMNEMTRDGSEMVATIRPQAEEMVASADRTMAQFETYAREDMVDLLERARAISEDFERIAADFSAISSGARTIFLTNSDNIDEMLRNLAQVSVNLKATSREIRRSPWRLLHRPTGEQVRTEQIQAAADAYATAAAELDDAAGKLAALRDSSGQEVPPDDPELRMIRNRLQDSFERFSQMEKALWLELADQP